MVKLINRLFPVRKCKTLPKQPCLYYHMHACKGYCFQEVDPQESAEMRAGIIRFLKGHTQEVKTKLEESMNAAIEELRFERAAEIHEEIQSIDYIQEKQTIDFAAGAAFDVFGWYEDKGYISFQGFFVREGKLAERNMSINPIYEDAAEAFTAYILQYYQTNMIPKAIYVPEGVDVEVLEQALQTKIIIPKRGEKKKLVDMALHNAKEMHDQKFQLVYKKDRELDAANRKLEKIFQKPIHHVELFDNSHISGAYNVSGLVVFTDGKPDKSQYRKFQLDDYKGDTDSMRQVVKRRYERLLKEERTLPDLLLVDGGEDQIKAAKEELDALGISITLAGLVKDDKHTTRGLIDASLQEIPLDKEEPLFFLLTRMQDEVHRFALSYHQQLRKKGMTRSILDDIPGVGPARKKQMNSRFPSLKKMREASLEEFEEILPKNSAALLYRRLHPEQWNQPEVRNEPK
jgi:excinuclease ABC subunit C